LDVLKDILLKIQVPRSLENPDDLTLEANAERQINRSLDSGAYEEARSASWRVLPGDSLELRAFLLVYGRHIDHAFGPFVQIARTFDVSGIFAALVHFEPSG
jgi:hypothetical protein